MENVNFGYVNSVADLPEFIRISFQHGGRNVRFEGELLGELIPGETLAPYEPYKQGFYYHDRFICYTQEDGSVVLIDTVRMRAVAGFRWEGPHWFNKDQRYYLFTGSISPSFIAYIVKDVIEGSTLHQTRYADISFRENPERIRIQGSRRKVTPEMVNRLLAATLIPEILCVESGKAFAKGPYGKIIL